jgi:hypothetical protein
MPKARALIEGASLGPEALKAACEAFDAAWIAIASQFKDPTELEFGQKLSALTGSAQL